MNRLKKIITCIMIIALTVTILNVQVADQTSVRAEAKNKYTGAVTLSNREKSEFQKVINRNVSKKIATDIEHLYNKKYTEFTRYALVKVVDKNVLIFEGDNLEGGSGNYYCLYYMRAGRVISSRTGGSRQGICGLNRRDGSLCMEMWMYPNPITSIKIDVNRLKEYNLMDSGDTMYPEHGKGHCKYNGKKITIKKYKKLYYKLYSDVYNIKFIDMRKNKKIKKKCQFVSNTNVYPMGCGVD